MQNESDILGDVSRRLSSIEVEFMLTGSMAMNFYAQPRMTRDIDFVVALNVSNIGKLIAAFAPDYYISPEAVISSVSRQSLFNAIHNETIVKVDFIVRKNSPYRRAEFERRKSVSIEGHPTWVASKEDLIISKLDWSKDSESDFQFRDIKNLVETGCDVAYIDRWTVELGLGKLWNRFKP